jgi:hypothetical protein
MRALLAISAAVAVAVTASCTEPPDDHAGPGVSIAAHELPGDGVPTGDGDPSGWNRLHGFIYELLLDLLLPDRHHQQDDFDPIGRDYDRPEQAGCLRRYPDSTCGGLGDVIARETCNGNVLTELFDDRSQPEPACTPLRWYWYRVDCADYCFAKHPGSTGSCESIADFCGQGLPAGHCVCTATAPGEPDPIETPE